MLETTKDIKGVIKDLIQNEIKTIKELDLYVITGINQDLTFNIKQMNLYRQYDSVEMSGVGFGNGRGLIFVPTVGTIVIVGFLKNSEKPIILGTLFDIYSTQKDAKIAINQNEVLLINQTNGAYIYINNNNQIKIKEPSGEYLLLNGNGLTTSNYNSSDGSQGITQTVQVRNSAGTGTNTITIKNGLIVGFT